MGKVESVSNLNIQAKVNKTDMRKLVRLFEHASHLWVILLHARDYSEGVYSLSLDNDRYNWHSKLVLRLKSTHRSSRLRISPPIKLTALTVKNCANFCKRQDIHLGYVPRESLMVTPTESGITDNCHLGFQKLIR